MSEHYSVEELAALREDEARCVRLLAACRRFAVKLGGAAGNYATFAQNEEHLLRSFLHVVEAHTGYEQLFLQRCQRAGLTVADVHRLQEQAELWQRESEEDE